MKKCLVPITILLICAFIITGCSNASPTTSKPIATTSGIITPASITPATTIPPVSSKPPSTTNPATVAPSVTKPVTTTASTTSAKYGGTLRMIQSTAPGTPIGWVPESAGASIFTMRLCLEYPLSELLDGSLIPNVAESYDVNPDPKNPSVTFHLRKGVKFHDGTDLNAQAVKWIYEQGKTGVNQTTTSYWKSFDILDDYTIRINHATWQNRMLRSFAALSAFLVSPTAYEKNGIDWMRWHMVGTGAFKQKDFQRDVATVTTRNENYWQTGKPYLDGITYLYVADEMTRVALFKSGGAETLDLAGNGRIANDIKAAGYNILSKQAGATILVPDSMNPTSPWSNIKVRQAAEYAIDKESVVRTLGYGYWKAAYQIPFAGSSAYDPGITSRTYDVAKAKQLLAEAGYPKGFKTKIFCSASGDKNVPITLQAYLATIGIQVDLDFSEPAKYQQYLNGTWDNGLIYNSLSDKPNYNVVINQYFGVPATWFKSLKKPDGWEKALAASVNSALPDPKLMQQCSRLFYDDATVIPLYSGVSLWATTPNVHDTGLVDMGSTDFTPENAWLSK
jgi:peptide/nickel transport system substrate-binding protein